MSSDQVKYEKKETITNYLFSADDYQKMGEAGIFDDKPKVELINGMIVARSPLTPYHTSHVDQIAEFFIVKLYKKAKTRIQGSVRLDNYSEPEPDIAILNYKKDNYFHAHPAPEDIYLLIEVAVETLAKDRTLKMEKYAQSNIPEYWIVIPKQKKIEVYRKPENGTYTQMETHGKEDEWEFKPFDLAIKGTDLLI